MSGCGPDAWPPPSGPQLPGLRKTRAPGAELTGEQEQYEDSYRLCYVRGPEVIILIGEVIIIGLAEQLS